MTENFKKLLELASNDEALKTKINNASKDELIALAKENGIALTDADFEAGNGEVSDDELDSVAGGKDCYCAMGGGGTASEGEKTCVCVAGGAGLMQQDWGGATRCVCVLTGAGQRTT